MLPLHLERVRDNARQAETEDLLDRITVYRAGMEDAALEIIDEELRRREISGEDIRRHEQKRAEVIRDSTGVARGCSYCRRPAVVTGWGWHRLLGVLPVFPRFRCYCEHHLPS
jgi:hypothetical protein